MANSAIMTEDYRNTLKKLLNSLEELNLDEELQHFDDFVLYSLLLQYSLNGDFRSFKICEKELWQCYTLPKFSDMSDLLSDVLDLPTITLQDTLKLISWKRYEDYLLPPLILAIIQDHQKFVEDFLETYEIVKIEGYQIVLQRLIEVASKMGHDYLITIFLKHRIFPKSKIIAKMICNKDELEKEEISSLKSLLTNGNGLSYSNFFKDCIEFDINEKLLKQLYDFAKEYKLCDPKTLCLLLIKNYAWGKLSTYQKNQNFICLKEIEHCLRGRTKPASNFYLPCNQLPNQTLLQIKDLAYFYNHRDAFYYILTRYPDLFKNGVFCFLFSRMLSILYKNHSTANNLGVIVYCIENYSHLFNNCMRTKHSWAEHLRNREAFSAKTSWFRQFLALSLRFGLILFNWNECIEFAVNEMKNTGNSVIFHMLRLTFGLINGELEKDLPILSLQQMARISIRSVLELPMLKSINYFKQKRILPHRIIGYLMLPELDELIGSPLKLTIDHIDGPIIRQYYVRSCFY
ncbi:unnamed protein product [Dimorphilus gyrociliatus]|uniref:Uncharacterized protein n=1 Tax=Dimorphilus gyrociliatus TaxID=2664684 RepID=A0A7I8VT91_9ANNE|nr:unnamed protein product [Dimorphilus gyrociliatus]